ncbi:hypothetical protein HMPREF9436_01067 [Faecalibacterium cf. prausnitzii KLE1255]|uniref:Uncharacterized protein n=1 Tax=Faecalibacterium cf. prausnitzii KLE1255 TaxID=748224 RepID=E2ZHC9_9FIRM|nr:hypothetical protein HMPREF9436_01067 [Faecalibacterium cf. prausnitzii KLE1255]
MLLKPPYGIIASEAAENKKCRLLFGNRQIIIKSYVAVFISRRTGTL